MKLIKHIFIFTLIIIFISSCIQEKTKVKLNEKEKEQLRIDTQILKSLNDSLNITGDIKYYDKYIHKINEMIIKYPDQKQLVEVKKNMMEIFEE